MTLEIKNVSKRYRKHQALKQINFSIEEETIYGLLGRNGAGKSTLLNIISHRIQTTSGAVTLDGLNVWNHQVAMGRIYLSSDDTWFSATDKIQKIYQSLELLYGDFDWELANQMITAFEVKTKKKLKSQSTGYKSIVKLIAALCVPADYIFLDEPVLGLDANHRQMFNRFLLEAYHRRPRTFVISTHIIEEIAYLLEQVVIIDEGQVKLTKSVEEVLQMGYTLSGTAEKLDPLLAQMTVIHEENLGKLKQVSVLGNLPEEMPEGVEVSHLNLQDFFISYTKRKGE